MTHKVETLIVGAGVIGSSVAMHLAQLGMKDIRVIDFDLEGSLSSSELNAGGVRATWNQPINIQMSQLTIDFFARHADEVGYRACGYLWLHPADRMPAVLQARERQVAMGWPVEVWDLAELKRRVPFIDKTDGIAAAVFGSRDGLVNPNLVKNYFRRKARELGVVFDDRTLLRKVEHSPKGASRFDLTTERFSDPLTQDDRIEVLTRGTSSRRSPERVTYQANQIINCAGPWAPKIAQMIGYPCPSYPKRRMISLFDCRDVDLTPYGMIVDTTGVYFHPEASNGLAGFATENERHEINYQYDGESFFMEHIWAALYERSSKFEALKHLTGWAGQYEVSPDESAIIGPVELGEAGRLGGVFEAHSFSGHGVMHSHTAGLVLAEKIVKGRYETMDASDFSGTRFEKGREISETFFI